MSDAAAPAKSKKTLIIALVALLLLGGAGGGAAWYFMHAKAAEHADEDEPAPRKKAPSAKPLFTTLEPFTVNLNDPRGERFAQVGVTLQFDQAEVEMQVKDHLPSIRNDVLMLISAKKVEELLTVDGKQRLAAEIRLAAGRALGVDLPDLDDEAAAEGGEPRAEKPKKKNRSRRAPENPITAVLFSQFIVQ